MPFDMLIPVSIKVSAPRWILYKFPLVPPLSSIDPVIPVNCSYLDDKKVVLFKINLPTIVH